MFSLRNNSFALGSLQNVMFSVSVALILLYTFLKEVYVLSNFSFFFYIIFIYWRKF